MKRVGVGFADIVSRENLFAAWRDFRRGKRSRESVRRFERTATREVVTLARELESREYRLGGFALKFLHEPKRRLVAAAPVRDRIVHHAIHRMLAPQLDRRLIDTTFACLEGRGSHRAALAFVAAMREYRYVLLLDIRHYFLSIDRDILRDIVERQVRDSAVVDLLALVIDSGRGLYRSPGVAEFLGLPADFPPPSAGLPIGNLTSQWWGNHYLNGLDHHAKRVLKIPHYQRYMDDVTIFADDPQQLLDARDAMAEWLYEHRRLRLKRPQAAPRSTKRDVTYLGFRASRRGISPTTDALRRMQWRIRDEVLHGDTESVERTIASYAGVLGLSAAARQVLTPSVFRVTRDAENVMKGDIESARDTLSDNF